jgi:hypothetical protein
MQVADGRLAKPTNNGAPFDVLAALVALAYLCYHPQQHEDHNNDFIPSRVLTLLLVGHLGPPSGG